MNQNKDPSGGQAVRMLRNHIRNGTFPQLIRDWKWILGFNRGHWLSISMLTVFGLGSSVLNLASSLLSKYLIDSIQTGDQAGLMRLIPILVLSVIFGVGFHALNSRFSAKLGITMQNHVQSTVFDRLIHGQWLGISKFSSGDLMNRFASDVSTVSGCAISLLPSLIIQTGTILITLAVIIHYDPVMALITCASTPVLFILSSRLMKKQREHNRIMREVSSELSSFQSETFRNMDTLKSFGIEDHVSKQLHQCQGKYRDVMLKYNRFSIQTHAALSVLSTAVQYLALGYCLWQLWNHNMELQTMMFFLHQRSSLQGAFSALIGLVPKALSGSVSAERLRELMEIPEEEKTCPDQVTEQRDCAVTLDNVTLAYTPGKIILRNVSLSVGPGQAVALVGPSGQGKTTLLRMLLGLIAPIQGTGHLTVSGQAPITLSPATRHYFTYVPQGNTLLAGTVADNLRMIDPKATEAQMTDALKAACAWEFVEKLPNGIHSILGEGGKGISEGQAQRIAIARALMRSAPIILLDEVTSALDMETEERVIQNLMTLGRTCILTTHRPSVLKMCTRVFRVEDGVIQPLESRELNHLTTNII